MLNLRHFPVQIRPTVATVGGLTATLLPGGLAEISERGGLRWRGQWDGKEFREAGEPVVLPTSEQEALEAVLRGTTYLAGVREQIVFTPRTIPGSHPAFPILTGFDAPAGWLDVRPGWLPIAPESEVIVPRLAAAVGLAREAGLIPFCVPLSGQRQPDGSFICEAPEPAPEGLEFTFLESAAEAVECPDSPLGNYLIQRVIPGGFVVEVLDGPDLAPVPVERQAIRLPDGTVQVPTHHPGHAGQIDAILVPQDGRIIDAVHAAYPGVAMLVTDVTRKGERTRLLQVR